MQEPKQVSYELHRLSITGNGTRTYLWDSEEMEYFIRMLGDKQFCGHASCNSILVNNGLVYISSDSIVCYEVDKLYNLIYDAYTKWSELNHKRSPLRLEQDNKSLTVYSGEYGITIDFESEQEVKTLLQEINSIKEIRTSYLELGKYIIILSYYVDWNAMFLEVICDDKDCDVIYCSM